MPKIESPADFEKIINQINNFSHAYLINSNSLDKAMEYAKMFAKKIILDNVLINDDREDILYKIDHDIFEDLYIVNPDTIGINNEEIEKLLQYMTTKSTRSDGKRVYIINGLERISKEISNKILKFLEEPEENIYAILLTANVDKILPTIISRVQTINLHFDILEYDENEIALAHKFLNKIITDKEKTIAYTNNILCDIISDREKIYTLFSNIENIISNTINKKYEINIKSVYNNKNLENFDSSKLITILDITNQLKQLIKKNINLNLLIDRYIIEVERSL